MNHWGYNGTMPGPTIEVNEGDRVRIVVHNELPEPTTLALARHWNYPMPWTESNLSPRIRSCRARPAVYELTLHQNGTFFYHPHMAMQEAFGMVGLFIIHPAKNRTSRWSITTSL